MGKVLDEWKKRYWKEGKKVLKRDEKPNQKLQRKGVKGFLLIGLVKVT